MYKSLLPIYIIDSNQIEDGSFIKLSKHCERKNIKCDEFYNRIKTSKGFHKCKYGFACLVTKDRIYTALKISGKYLKSEVKKIDVDLQNPVLTEKQLYEIIQTDQFNRSIIEKSNEFLEKTNLMLHDSRQINADIKYKSESLIDLIEKFSREIKTKHLLEDLKKYSNNIFHGSNMILNNFSLVDILVNPDSIKYGSKNSYDIYKKFDKCKKMMATRAAEKIIRIKLSNNVGNLPIEVFQTFEQVPYILLDNALKYSENNSTISVVFEKRGTKVVVTTSSTGPTVKEEELNKIFEYKYRGDNARNLTIRGSGIGLYLAKMICDSNNFKIYAKNKPLKLSSKLADKSEFSIIIEAPLYNKVNSIDYIPVDC